MDLFSSLKNAILQNIPHAQIEVLDPRLDGRHLEVVVVSPIFESLTLLERHRLVLDPIKNLFERDLHALSIKTFTPQEIEE